MKYYPLLYRLDAEERYLIWTSDEKDGVLADASGAVQSFNDIDSVQARCVRQRERRRHQIC
jgi:hypothetical protein